MEKEGDERKSDPKRRRIDGKIHVRPHCSTVLHGRRVCRREGVEQWKGTERVMAS